MTGVRREPATRGVFAERRKSYARRRRCVGRSGGAHHTTCTTIRHIMGMGRSSAATSHVRPNRLSAGIPAGPLARAATSASDARDADKESPFSSTPTLADFHGGNEAARECR